jgi:nicotinamide phosphoribosyltransferase
MNHNFILLADSYKVGHYKQYPPKTEFVLSYFESRGGKFDEVTFFSLQHSLKRFFVGKVITEEIIVEAKEYIDAHLGEGAFNEAGWRLLLERHGGRLPLRIKAVPEGTSVGVSNVLMTIENLDPEFYWLTQYIEGLIQQIWYGCTVATFSREVRKLLRSYLTKTTSYDKATQDSILNFAFHDFGLRSSTSPESAGIGALAHLVNFMGTDTMPALYFGRNFYNTKAMLGFSVNATEHSTTTAWGRENEFKAYEHFMETFPTGTLSVVSDSYGIRNAVKNGFCGELKDKVLARDGRLVIRPDSGDPVMTLKVLLHILWEEIGGTVNDKGFKVLNDKVRLIQGDGVNYDSIKEILDMFVAEGFSTENIVMGCGTVLLQNHNRDTQKFAIKCCNIVIDGVEQPVIKDPTEIDAQGNEVKSFKKSKAGRLKLVKIASGDKAGEFVTISSVSGEEEAFNAMPDSLVTVFEMGELVTEYTFEEIRERAYA